MTSYVNIYGRSPLDLDMPNFVSGAPAFASGLILAASVTLGAMTGKVWHPSRPAGTFNIRKVYFRTGAITFNAGSVLTISLQDVSTTAGPPYRPDGTPDQTATLTGAAVTATSLLNTGALSADRTVSAGADLSVVFQITTFTALDSVVVSTVSAGVATNTALLAGDPLINTAGTWAGIGNALNNIFFECDDGTRAFFEGAFPYAALGNVSVATNVTARAAGNLFTVPCACKVDRFALNFALPSGADGSLILYDGDGTTALLTTVVDNNMVLSSSGRSGFITFAPITLQPSTNYRFVYVPSTTTAATIYYADVGSAADLDILPWGQQCMYTQRDSGGTWTQTATRRCHWGMGLSAIPDGSGGGGAGPLIGGRLVR